MLKKSALTCLLMLAVLVQGQIAAAEDCNCPEKEKDPAAWDKSIAMGFNLTDGNSNTSLLNANAKASRDYQSDVWIFELDGNYGESDGGDATQSKETTQQDVTVKGEYQYLLTDMLYVGFGTKYNYDDIKEVDYRVTLKPVLGYYVIKDEDMKLSFEAGPAYVFEKVGGIKDNYLAPRIADRFEWEVSETAKLFQNAEYIFDSSDSDNYQVVGEVGVEAAINSWLSLVITAKDEYDNQPAAGKERNDVSVVSGLAVLL